VTLGRREFLRRLSAALAALGISDMALVGAANTYQAALANPSRCLALLVGINTYPASTWQSDTVADKEADLQGALTDVELQRELLINRFGILPGNIATLVNEDATVNQILETIQGHLVDNAQTGDTVIFHFSGLGSQIHLTGQPDGAYLPTLVAADSHLPIADVPVVQDLFEESIAQTLSGLKGVKVLTIIDASETATPERLKGNFRVRSRPISPKGSWQAPFNTRLKVPRQSLEKLSANWPGLLLRANAAGLPALEGNWGSFSAGLFTYALTQQIWTSLPAQRQQWLIHRINRKLSAWTGTDQSSQIGGKQSVKAQELPLLSGRLPKPAADGVVKTVDTVNNSAILWLGGLPPGLLPYCELGLRLRPLPTLPGLAAIPSGTLTVKVMEGLRAKAEFPRQASVPVGTPLVEIERRFPKEMVLNVALDPDLERIERVDATSALSGLPFITTTVPGEKPADCLFGKGLPRSQSEPSSTSTLESELAHTGDGAATALSQGYGLFTPDRTPIVGTVAEEGEAVKTAVSRLHGPLRGLLAAKMLRLTVNPMSSQLPVRLTLETQEPSRQLLLLEETQRSRQIKGISDEQAKKLSFSRLPTNRSERYQIRMLNSGQVELYYVLVSIVDQKQLSIYCPPSSLAEGSELTSRLIAEASLLPVGQFVKFPQMEESTFSLQPLQATEVFAIAGTQPFIETWKAIRTPEFRQLSDRWSTIPEPLAMTKGLFRDLNRASAQLPETAPAPPEGILALRAGAWSTLSL
jgi:hypothetical protein